MDGSPKVTSHWLISSTGRPRESDPDVSPARRGARRAASEAGGRRALAGARRLAARNEPPRAWTAAEQRLAERVPLFSEIDSTPYIVGGGRRRPSRRPSTTCKRRRTARATLASARGRGREGADAATVRATRDLNPQTRDLLTWGRDRRSMSRRDGAGPAGARSREHASRRLSADA